MCKHDGGFDIVKSKAGEITDAICSDCGYPLLMIIGEKNDQIEDMYLSLHDKDIYSELGRIATQCIGNDMWYCGGIYGSSKCLKIRDERQCKYIEFCCKRKLLKGKSNA